MNKARVAGVAGEAKPKNIRSVLVRKSCKILSNFEFYYAKCWVNLFDYLIRYATGFHSPGRSDKLAAPTPPTQEIYLKIHGLAKRRKCTLLNEP